MKIQLRPRPGATLRCAVCHSSEAGWQICPRCRTQFHAACRAWLKRCPTLGCAPQRGRVVRVQLPRGAETTEPPRHWAPVLVWGFSAGVLGLWVLVNLAGPHTDTSLSPRTKADFKVMSDAVELFRIDQGRYPNRLSELWERPPDARWWREPYLKEYPPLDRWGAPYQYVLAPGEHPVLTTLGADSAPGGVGEAMDLSHDVGRGVIDWVADARVYASAPHLGLFVPSSSP